MADRLNRAQRSAINKRALKLASRLRDQAYHAYRIRLTEMALIDPDSIDADDASPGPDISDLLEFDL